MIGDPKKLRTRGGHGFLVGRRDRLRSDEAQAAESLADQLLSDPANVNAMRRGLGRPEASIDELREWLNSGLASGSLSLLRTRAAPRQLRSTHSQDLRDLVDGDSSVAPTRGAETEAALTEVSVEVVDQHGQRPSGGELRFSLNGAFSTHPAFEKVHKTKVSEASEAGAGCLFLDFESDEHAEDRERPRPVTPEVVPTDVLTFVIVTPGGDPIPASYRLLDGETEVAAGHGAELSVSATHQLSLELEV